MNSILCRCAPVLLAFTLSSLPAFANSPSNEAVALNNEGVRALNRKDGDAAIGKFKDSLKKAPGYGLAIENLAIAYNNIGTECAADKQKALQMFHMSAWLQPDNKTSRENVESLLQRIGRDPKHFEDRVEVADNCVRHNDFAGAIVEYQAALKLKDDSGVRKKMESITIPQEWKTIRDAPPLVAEADVDFGPYMAELQRRIKRAWFPPRGQESRRLTAVFKVKSDGEVSDLKLSKSSGVKVADDAALEAISSAAPFRPLPQGAPATVDIQFTFDYNVFDKKPAKEKELLEAVAKLERENNKEALPEAWTDLASYYNANNQQDKAITYFKKALDELTAQNRNVSLQDQDSASLADIYYDQDNYVEALPLYRKVLQMRLDDDTTVPESLAHAYRDLGYALIYCDSEHGEEALANLNKAVEFAQKAKDDETVLDAKYGMGHAFWQEGDYAKARSQYDWVVTETERAEGSQSPKLVQRLKDLADCQFELGQTEKACANYKRMLSLADMTGYSDGDQLAEAKARVAEIDPKAQVAQAQRKAYSWLPYALGGALLSLMMIYLFGNRRNSSVNLTGKAKADDQLS